MENDKKWRPEILDTKFMGDFDSKWHKSKDQYGRYNESRYETGPLKTPSGIPYSMYATQHKYHMGKPPRYMELEMPDVYMGGRDFTQDELADFVSMYENGNPFHKNFKKVDYGETDYAPYVKSPEYDAWLKQFRDYARDKWGITDEDEARFYSSGLPNPMLPDYPGDDFRDSMGTRAARYFSDMRGVKSVPELFDRKK